MTEKRITTLLGVIAILLALGGLLREEPARLLPEGVSHYSTDTEFSALCFYRQDLYAGGRGGFYRFDGQDFALLSEPSVTFVRAMAVYQDCLYIGAEQGLFRFDGNTFENVLPLRIQCLAPGEKGLWVGTLEGAYRLPDRLHLTAEDGLTANYVSVILPLADGGAMFGGYMDSEGGVALWREGRGISAVSTSEGLPHPYVSALLEVDRGEVWVGTGYVDEGGACLLSTGGGNLSVERTLTKADGLAGEKVRSLYRDLQGNIWFGSESSGLAIFRGDTRAALLTRADYLSHNEVLCFLEAPDGGLWLGTPGGVTYLEQALVERISQGENNERGDIA